MMQARCPNEGKLLALTPKGTFRKHVAAYGTHPNLVGRMGDVCAMSGRRPDEWAAVKKEARRA